MGLSHPPEARTRQSAPDDVEANILQKQNTGNCGSSLQEINTDRGEEAGRQVIIWAPILCIAFLMILGVSVWGLHLLLQN
jgi:hypothetical protein